ncbi:MAG: hypothetical protein EHM20_00125 [Alphaproteobacteria bacterium]|nr:MAG: hypothetical protein EHM20_00125 [Alphaproteobacteria bacterium]
MEDEFKPRIMTLDDYHFNLERILNISIYDPETKEFIFEKNDHDFDTVIKQFDFVDAVFKGIGDLHIELETQHYYVHCEKIKVILFES